MTRLAVMQLVIGSGIFLITNFNNSICGRVILLTPPNCGTPLAERVHPEHPPVFFFVYLQPSASPGGCLIPGPATLSPSKRSLLKF